nr:zonular occludens toxin domain-containing protein [Pseudomonas aeruginosa]
MFVLRTGLQGNSKTLNTIKEVDTKAAKEGRVVYYHNIRGVQAGSSGDQGAMD